MTPADIILIAQEAGVEVGFSDWRATNDTLVKFAALVAAHEREECAKVCDATETELWDVYKGRSETDQTRRGQASEYIQGGSDTAQVLAKAIRARGEKP